MKLVEVPGFGDVEFPDEMSDEQIVSVLRSQVDNGSGRAASAGNAFMRGGGEAVGMAMSGLARVGELLGRSGVMVGPGGAVPFTAPAVVERRLAAATQTPAQREQELAKDPLYLAGQELAAGAREAYQANPRYAGEFWTDTIPGSAGQMVPTLALGLVSPPAAVAQYSLTSGQQGAEEALAAGRPDQTDVATLGYGLAGAASEALLGVPANVVKRLYKPAMKGIDSAAMTLLKAPLYEGAQEGVEQVLQNATAKSFDPQRELGAGVPEAVAAGMVLGLGVGGGVRLLAGRPINDLQETPAPEADLNELPPEQPQVTERPIPEPEETLRAQFDATLDPESSKAVTLLVPGAPTLDIPDGLEAVEVPQGVAVFNPKKATAETVRQAGAGEQFDGRLLGMSQSAKPEGPVVAVTTKAPDGTPEVVGELVNPEPAAIAKAAEAQQRAVPGGTTEIRNPQAVLNERLRPAAKGVAIEPSAPTPTETPAETAQRSQASPVTTPEAAAPLVVGSGVELGTTAASQPTTQQATPVEQSKRLESAPEAAPTEAASQPVVKDSLSPAAPAPVPVTQLAGESALRFLNRMDAAIRQNTYSDPLLLTPLAKLAIQIAKALVKGGMAIDQAIRNAVQQARAQMAHATDDDAALIAALEKGLNVREFTEQVDTATDVPQVVKDAVLNRLYERKPNEDTAAFAARIADRVGTQGAMEVFRDQTSGLDGAERTMLGQIIVKRLSAEGQHDAAARFLDDDLLPYSTNAGQALQAFAAFGRLSPQGVLAYGKRQFNKAQGGVADRAKPAVNAVADTLAEINQKGIEATVNSPDVQRQAGEAIDGTIQAQADQFGTEIHRLATEDTIEGLRKAGKLTDAQADGLRRILAGQATWAEVFGKDAKRAQRQFAEAKEKVSNKVKEKSTRLRKQKLTNEADTDPLDRAIRAEIRKMRTTLGQLVRRHYTVVDGVERDLQARLVSDAGLTEDAAARLASRISKRFRALVEEVKAREIAKIERAHKRVPYRVKQAWERILELSNLGAIGRPAAWAAVAEKLKLPTWTPEIAQELQARADQIQRTPEGFQRDRKVVELHNYLARQIGVPISDLGMDFWYANMLSGPTTQAVNLLANVLNLTSNLVIQARHPADFVAQLAGTGRGLKRGGQDSVDILKTGIVTRTGDLKLEASRPLELVRLPGWQDYLLTPFRMVGRALAAGDALFFRGGQEMRRTLLARQLARDEGLSGGTLSRRVAETLGRTAELRAAATKQAMAEGLSGLTFERRVDELLDAATPAAVRDNARSYALRMTYNQKPYGLLGAVAQGINWIGRQPGGRPVRFVVPFTNIVANVANEGLNYVPPVGLARAIAGHWSGNLEGQPIQDRNALGDQYAKAALGTLLMGLVWAAAEGAMGDDDPWFAITGGGPGQKNQRDQLRASGWIPYSIKLNGRYYSYSSSPTAIGLSIMGNWFDAVRYRRLTERGAWDRLAFALKTAGRVITEQSFLDGLASLAGAIKRDDVKGGDDLAKTLGRTASSFVVPNALRQIDRMFDPTVYDANTIESGLLATVPFVRRQGKPALNPWGESVRAEISKRFVSDWKPTELEQVLARRGLWISAPQEDQLEIAGKPVTSDEFYEFIKARGQALKAMASRPEVLKVLTSGKNEDTVKAVWGRYLQAASAQGRAAVVKYRQK